MRKEILENAKIFGEIAIPHLWRDEIGDIFVLSRHMEIFCFSKTLLSCYCWHQKTYFQLKKMEVIINDLITDDRIYHFHTNQNNLPLLLSMGAFKRRPHKRGAWLRRTELKLGHKIQPLTSEQTKFLKNQFR